ncbi:MAG TPA: hypothetical protein VFW47_14220 [Phenylobacterium sp.]|nr:hypothetical protein [Phenylobacterium sp.]
MTAVACLRVAVDADSTGLSPAALGPLVAKFSAAYLETRWLWPRAFQPLTHYAFLLTDPRSEEMDVRELALLSDELQVKLFGLGSEGEVALLLFEGSPEAARAFAALDSQALAAAIENPDLLPTGGRLSRVVSPGAVDMEPEIILEAPPKPVVEASPEPTTDAVPSAPALPALEGLHGIYFAPRGLFVADVVSSTPGTARTHFSLVEGSEHMPDNPAAFDADCVIAAMRFLTEGVKAMLYLPICYSNIVRLSQRQDYERLLSVLPEAHRNQLAAAVYDVPRDPAFGALSQMKAMLSRYVTNIDLRTFDPGFEIEKLQPQAVTSVTLVLPDSEPRVRLAVLRRFTDRLDLYRRKQIWQAVTNVRSRSELSVCAQAKVPFVTGPAICRMQTLPVGGRMQPLAELPVLAA